ncbi:right-handed parallel beta-helix repeat-containing protein [Paenibacillus puerhi]|uniref:right-handed parallel beta-helix repeat-containing protein n=1 Tax=Paenibacillus puerhi TaxID=2692622 RepID=UPI001357B7CC|nr:right-handed parallel beta-helix repeat-containing protein [Paenibacillus puerhi]
MSMDSDSLREKRWSRRKLIAAMGTTAAGLVLGGGSLQPVAAAAPLSSIPGASGGAAPGWLNVKDYGAKGNGHPYDNDAPAIQAAIHAAGRGRFGGTVYLPAGKYRVESSLVLLSNVQLVGDGIGATTIISGQVGIPIIIGHQLKKAMIERLSLEGFGTLTNTTMELIERGVDLKDSEQVTVRNCSFYWIASGVGIRNCRQITVEDCMFEKLNSTESASQEYGIFMEAGERNSLQNNRFKQLDKSCIYVSAGSSHSVIAGNVAEECKAALVTVSSPLQPCTHLRIEANQVLSAGLPKGETNGKHGIVLRGYCADNVIAGNMIARMGEAGIFLEGDAAAATERPQGNLVTGNQLTDCPTGIALMNSDANSVTGNDVRRSKVGIRLAVLGEKAGSVCRDNVISGNTLFRCKEAGIKIASTRCRSNAVFGNGGTGNGEAIEDEGQDTIRSGF